MDDKYANNLGCQQSWVAKGKTKEERKKRFDAAPDALKPQIWNHLKTIKSIKDKDRN